MYRSTQRQNKGFKLKYSRFLLDNRKKFFTGGWSGTAAGFPEELELPHPGSAQGQSGWRKPGLVVGVPAHGRRVGSR